MNLSDLYSADFAARDTYANDDSKDAFSFVHERIRKKDSSGDAVGGYVNNLVANTMDLTPSYHMNAQPYFKQSLFGAPPINCGDGTVNNSDEECDDGNLVDGDGCSSICRLEYENIPNAATNTPFLLDTVIASCAPIDCYYECEAGYYVDDEGLVEKGACLKCTRSECQTGEKIKNATTFDGKIARKMI